MSNTNENVLVENVSTLNYWRYLEYAKKVLRMAGPRALGGCGSIGFIFTCTALIVFFFTGGRIHVLLKDAGLIMTVLIVLALLLSILFFGVSLCCFISPTILITSRFRTKHAKKFFTDKEGVKHKSYREDYLLTQTDEASFFR